MLISICPCEGKVCRIDEKSWVEIPANWSSSLPAPLFSDAGLNIIWCWRSTKVALFVLCHGQDGRLLIPLHDTNIVHLKTQGKIVHYSILCFTVGVIFKNFSCALRLIVVFVWTKTHFQFFATPHLSVLNTLTQHQVRAFVFCSCGHQCLQKVKSYPRSGPDWPRCQRMKIPHHHHLSLRYRRPHPTAWRNSGTADAANSAEPNWSWRSKRWVPVAAVRWCSFLNLNAYRETRTQPLTTVARL